MKVSQRRASSQATIAVAGTAPRLHGSAPFQARVDPRVEARAAVRVAGRAALRPAVPGSLDAVDLVVAGFAIVGALLMSFLR